MSKKSPGSGQYLKKDGRLLVRRLISYGPMSQRPWAVFLALCGEDLSAVSPSFIFLLYLKYSSVVNFTLLKINLSIEGHISDGESTIDTQSIESATLKIITIREILPQ